MQSKVCISHLPRAQQWQHTGGRGLLDWAAPSLSFRRAAAAAVAPQLGPQGSAVEWRSLSGGEGRTHSTKAWRFYSCVCLRARAVGCFELYSRWVMRGKHELLMGLNEGWTKLLVHSFLVVRWPTRTSKNRAFFQSLFLVIDVPLGSFWFIERFF